MKLIKLVMKILVVITILFDLIYIVVNGSPFVSILDNVYNL